MTTKTITEPKAVVAGAVDPRVKAKRTRAAKKAARTRRRRLAGVKAAETRRAIESAGNGGAAVLKYLRDEVKNKSFTVKEIISKNHSLGTFRQVWGHLRDLENAGLVVSVREHGKRTYQFKQRPNGSRAAKPAAPRKLLRQEPSEKKEQAAKKGDDEGEKPLGMRFTMESPLMKGLDLSEIDGATRNLLMAMALDKLKGELSVKVTVNAGALGEHDISLSANTKNGMDAFRSMPRQLREQLLMKAMELMRGDLLKMLRNSFGKSIGMATDEDWQKLMSQD